MNASARCPKPLPVPGELEVPAGASGVLVVAHRGEAPLQAPGRRFFADVMQANGIATLAIALPPDVTRAGTPAELRQLEAALGWLACHRLLAALPRALLGWNTAVAPCAALACGPMATRIDSLVLVDGGPDAGSAWLAALRTPTLMLHGARSPSGLAVRAPHRRIVLAQATRPQSEPGAHEAIAHETLAWIRRHALTMPLAPRQSDAEDAAYDRFHAA